MEWLTGWRVRHWLLQDVEAPTLGLQYTWSHTTPAYNPEVRD